MDLLAAARAVLGFLLVFILPGVTWSFIFFKQLEVVERISLSFALSLVLVTLSLLAANRLIHLKITGLNALIVIILVTVIPVVYHYLNKLVRWRRAKAG